MDYIWHRTTGENAWVLWIVDKNRAPMKGGAVLSINMRGMTIYRGCINYPKGIPLLEQDSCYASIPDAYFPAWWNEQTYNPLRLRWVKTCTDNYVLWVMNKKDDLHNAGRVIGLIPNGLCLFSCPALPNSMREEGRISYLYADESDLIYQYPNQYYNTSASVVGEHET